jgi:hypothetical protein
MKMKVKKLVSRVSLMFALLLVVGAFLTGCGGSSSSGGGGSNNVNMAGTWLGSWTSNVYYAGGALQAKLVNQGANNFSGTVWVSGSAYFDYGSITGTVTGSSITMGAVFDGNYTTQYSGTVNGNAWTGNYTAGGSGLNDSGTFTLVRQ